MTIDFWGLGLQAVNVLILIWLLSRVFWRPVAAAIAKRQATATAVIETAQETQAKADAALNKAEKAHADNIAEREKILADARSDAAHTTKAALQEARAKARAILAEADTTVARNAETARTANEGQAADLAFEIAAKLLANTASPAVQSTFLDRLIDAIEKMSATDRAALLEGADHIDVVLPDDPDHDTGVGRKHIENAIGTALGGSPDLRFVTDPQLIAGVELRSPHFVLHNSWQADLDQLRKAVTDAA